MEEAVTNCETLREVEVDERDKKMVRWERFLPRMSFSVLLVEADDSSRQVITAILRKCSYKVAAVSDGLKAWEVLKGSPNGIDLILTEVDLPSISGFALLTLIMEHDGCKNIPVIMMSSDDSVNMVYKCMLRGAADFLVKPVRRNELQNLWQHVWRRQASASGGQVVPDESITQHKVEGLADNDVPNNLSDGVSTPNNEECNEKGNDAQSSSSVRGHEAENVYTENGQGGSKLKFNKVTAHDNNDEGDCVRGDSPVLKTVSVVRGSSKESLKDDVRVTQQVIYGRMELQENRNTYAEASDNNDAIVDDSREARDLIGTFQNYCTKSCINLPEIASTSENDSCPQLDLSLRRYDDSRAYQDTTVDDRRQVVQQSNASAFSRYKASKTTHHTQASAQPRVYEGSFDKDMSSPVQPSSFYSSISRLDSQKSAEYQASGKLREGEPFSSPQSRTRPVTVQVKRVRLDRTCTSYGSSLHPSYYNQTGASPTPSPDSAGRREVLSGVMLVSNPNVSSCSNQTVLRQDVNQYIMEHMRNVSSANEISQNSSLCDGDLSRLNSFGCGSACGSNGSGNPVESKADGIPAQDENTNRSLQREAALAKFRQKRNDRCFEKKVRYESRKKLAEQRPRVKGQFARQVPTYPTTAPAADL